MKNLWHKIKSFFKWLFLGDHQITYGRVPISLKGLKWDLHITDLDPTPSVPHLHCIENKNLKVNVYNGEVYDDGINIGKLKDKEFNALWHNKKFLQMVQKARDFYIKQNPNCELVKIPITVDDIDDNVVVCKCTDKEGIRIEYKNAKKEKKS